QVADQGDIAVSLGHRLLIHAEPGDDPSLLGLLPARHGPFHDVPGFVPTEAEQPGTTQDVGLEQHVDGLPLERDGQATAGQGPGEADLSDAMFGTGDPGRSRVQPGQAVAMIEVPPLPVREMIIERGPSATFRATNGGVAPVCQPKIDLVLLRVESNALVAPREVESYG